MSLIDEGIARIRGARAMLLNQRATRSEKLLESARLKGAHFRPGDRARDRVTGEQFDVIDVHFEAVFTPVAGRERS